MPFTMEKIADVLDRKYPQFNTVTPDCFVSDALYKMYSENVDYLIVLEDNKFQGIITDHDIAGKILFEHRPLNKIEVKEFMSRTLPVATSDSSLEYSMQLMERYNVRHLAIFDRFTFRGVISSYDLMQETLNKRGSNYEESINKRHGYPWNY
jgi:CBS domain-containing protein